MVLEKKGSPDMNFFQQNAGYLAGAMFAVGMILQMTRIGSSASHDKSVGQTMLETLWPFIVVAAILYLRYALFARNPQGSQRISGTEFDEMREAMQGSWLASTPHYCNPTVQTSAPVEINGTNATVTNYGKHGPRQTTFQMTFFRAPDGAIWYLNNGNKMYDFNLTGESPYINFHNYSGQLVSWTKNNNNAVSIQVNPYTNNPPTAPTHVVADAPPPTYGNSTGGSTVPQPEEKSLAEKISEIAQLRDQGILSEEEFSNAKMKLIQNA